ncbi:MAG: DUF6565 domain-containing protein [Bacteroidota bacterium]
MKLGFLSTTLLSFLFLFISTSCEVERLNKDMYLKQFSIFMEEIADNYMTYEKIDWERKEVKFKQFTREYYDLHIDKMNESELKMISVFKKDYYICKTKSKGKRILKTIEDGILKITS